jgi:hypothetical protein
LCIKNTAQPRKNTNFDLGFVGCTINLRWEVQQKLRCCAKMLYRHFSQIFEREDGTEPEISVHIRISISLLGSQKMKRKENLKKGQTCSTAKLFQGSLGDRPPRFVVSFRSTTVPFLAPYRQDRLPPFQSSEIMRSIVAISVCVLAMILHRCDNSNFWSIPRSFAVG